MRVGLLLILACLAFVVVLPEASAGGDNPDPRQGRIPPPPCIPPIGVGCVRPTTFY